MSSREARCSALPAIVSGQRCARSRCCQASPIRRGSMRFPTHRRRTARFWSAAGARRLRHRSRDRLGRLWLGARRASSVWCSATSRSARSKRRPRARLRARRPGGRHRAAARSGALPRLRRRRMGHVPQRPLHRARHQGAARLRRRAVPHRARIRRQGRSRTWARSACCSSRPASSPRRGIIPRGSGGVRARGSRGPCWSPAPARSACWRR